MSPLLAEEKTPVDLLLEEQRLMTPAARFSREHERPDFDTARKRHSDLIPLTRPGPGEQYAFEVDLDVCTGCKACVTACHSLNGLEDNETWRDVGLLLGGTREEPFQQTVTTACHHCIDPGCLNGCPVLAYDKDPVTGIVRHLDDQCIGCQYCILKCPYDVPKYSPGKGIVRKCDMCHQRLAEGEAPACAQACPNEAIRIVHVMTQDIAEDSRKNEGFLPGAPAPDTTAPTTRYRSGRTMPADIRPADRDTLIPEHAHAPLIVMLVLTQLSVGGFVAALLLPDSAPLLLAAWITGLAGLNASLLHLGQPLKAWRAFLGWRTSWLSREIIVFGAFGGIASVAAATNALSLRPPAATPALPDWILVLLNPAPPAAAAALAGLAGVFCSAMIYHDTGRPFWKLPLSGGKFFGTTALLGLAAAWCWVPAGWAVTLAIMIVAGVKLTLEAAFLRHGNSDIFSPLRKSALLQRRPLRGTTLFRFAAGTAGGIAAPLAGFLVPASSVLPVTALLLLLAGEFAERSLFFRAVAAPKMPGGTGG